jgi:thiol-disulfide isomerase/thioredoxin
MKQKGILFLLLGLLAGVIIGAVLFVLPGSQNTAGQQLPPTVGSPAKDFVLEDLTGDEVRLSSLKGKPVVLNFWATWCPPCKEEMPLLEEYSDTYSEQVVVIGVNTAEDHDLVQHFITEKGVTFPIALDKAGIVSDMYFVRNYPTTFFLDKDGVLRAQHAGQLDAGLLDRYFGLIGVTQ